MGFERPNLDMAKIAIRHALGEIHSPYNDGWNQSICKQELYMLKCWLDDAYSKLPTFVGDEKWEQDRILEILKQ